MDLAVGLNDNDDTNENRQGIPRGQDAHYEKQRRNSGRLGFSPSR